MALVATGAGATGGNAFAASWGGWRTPIPSGSATAIAIINAIEQGTLAGRFRQNSDGPGWTQNVTTEPDTWRPIPFKPEAVGLSQVGFRARNDDGNEAVATWKTAENTNWTQVIDQNVRVRFVINEMSGVDAPLQEYKLHYNLNGAGWNPVTGSSSVVRASASSLMTDGEATTRQLSSGNGAFTSGGFDEGDGGRNVDLGAAGGVMEFEFCVQVRSADVVSNDTIQLRVQSPFVSGTTWTPLPTYSQVPTITVSEIVLDQVGFRGRNDDGNETGATPKAAENTNWAQAVDTNFRIRFVVDETGGGDPPSFDYAIQYNRNGAGWNDVTASSLVARASASGSVANGVATTRQLSSGTGTFRAGAVDTNNGAAGAIDLAAGELTEVEFCMQLRSADVVNGDTVQFRVFDKTSIIPLNTYSQVPSITVGTGVNATATPATVAVTTSVPSPTVLAAAQPTPAVVAITTSVPSPTILVDAQPTPAVVAVSVSVPSPTIRITTDWSSSASADTTVVDATATPSTVAVTTSVPSPTTQAAAQPTPAVVAVAVAVPTPTLLVRTVTDWSSEASDTTQSGAVNATATPAVIAVSVAVPTPTIHGQIFYPWSDPAVETTPSGAVTKVMVVTVGV